MLAVAAILSLVLFLAFVTSGAQRIIFNPMMSESAADLGFTKRAYQRIGALEVAGGLGLLVGLSAKGGSLWAIVNELAAAGLFVAMVLAVYFHLRKHDPVKVFAPALILAVAALLELILRLTS
jgi:hypothetical protein